MNGFSPPKDLSCVLTKYFELKSGFEDSVCISPFTAWEKKNISLSKWEQIVSFVNSKGLKVVQIGGNSEPTIKGAEKKLNLSYFESAKVMLSCKFLICLDGGMSWVASAYKQKVLGLYGYHFDGLMSPKIYQPINENAIYLESKNAEDIQMNLIFDNIIKYI